MKCRIKTNVVRLLISHNKEKKNKMRQGASHLRNTFSPRQVSFTLKMKRFWRVRTYPSRSIVLFPAPQHCNASAEMRSKKIIIVVYWFREDIKLNIIERTRFGVSGHTKYFSIFNHVQSY